MHPIFFSIGDFQVHSYGALAAIAFLSVAIITLNSAESIGVNRDRMSDLIFWSALSALAGSRALFVYQNSHLFSSWTQWFNIRTGGLVFYGAVLTALVVGSLLMRKYKMPFYGTWDLFASVVPIAHGLTRIGCFAAGCCHGLPSNLPWAVTFDHPLTNAPKNIPLHPTQLYEVGFLLLLGGFLQWMYRRKTFNGQIMLLYLMCYAAGRCVLEEFRGDVSRGFFMPQVFGEWLTASQGISLCVAIFAFGVFLIGARRAHRSSLIG